MGDPVSAAPAPEPGRWAEAHIETSVNQWKETVVERKVTYTVEVDGTFVVIENVPARVCLETGEQFFSPETVERLQHMI